MRKLWEALLCAQPEMQSGQGAARLQALVQARLVGSVTSTKRVAENKRIYDLGSGFIMTKVLPWRPHAGHKHVCLACIYQTPGAQIFCVRYLTANYMAVTWTEPTAGERACCVCSVLQAAEWARQLGCRQRWSLRTRAGRAQKRGRQHWQKLLTHGWRS